MAASRRGRGCGLSFGIPMGMYYAFKHKAVIEKNAMPRRLQVPNRATE